MKVPSDAIVTLPPRFVEKVPVVRVTPPAGVSFPVSLALAAMKGVDGDDVEPPVTTSCTLLTWVVYWSKPAKGLTAMENCWEPVQLRLSVAVTVKVKVPVAVGVPLNAPAVERVMPVGRLPAVFENV